MNAAVPNWTAPTSDTTSGLYPRAFRRHWPIIAVITVAALAASMAWLLLRAPEYEAKAQVLVAPVSPDAQIFAGLPVLRDSGSDTTRVLETAATLFRSPQAAQRTARLMGPGWDPGRVLDSVDVTPEARSNILEVVGRSDRAAESARLSNNFTRAGLLARAEALQRQVDATLARLRAREQSLRRTESAASADLSARISELEAVREGGDPTLSLAREASVPTSRAGAAAPVMLILSLITGLALGMGAAVLLEMLNRRVRDENEAMELSDLPVLARVPLLPRRARGGSPTAGVMPGAIREAFRTVIAQLTADNHKGSRSIMVTSASSGDGKTTSAVGLAIALATAGYQVLLVDLDLRRPGVAQALGVKAEPLETIVSVDPKSFGDLFREVPGIPTLSVLATAKGWQESNAVKGPGGGTSPLMDSEARDIQLVEMLYERVPLLLAEARAAADFVIIDTPPVGEVSDALRIASEIDDVIVVIRPRHTNRGTFAVMRDLLERTGHVPTGMLVIGGNPPVKPQDYSRGRRAPGSRRPTVSLRR